ncbi:MAG: hypothetical protein RL429_1137 [Bacteroidota bacterium]|jgi:hypothetical protein
MYISITGLKPHGLRSALLFWRYAIPSFNQARSAKGNTFCQVKRINGYQCTLTAWTNESDMRAFMVSGVHRSAMAAFPKIATGRTYGFESSTIPSWEEAVYLLESHGREYRVRRN